MVALCALAVVALAPSIVAGPEPAAATVLLNARARAAGNRRASAVALGSALLRTIWPAQILKVRVDGVGPHEVAGLVLSGVKFHRPLDPGAFAGEVAALAQRAFAHSGVEEVDVWATVPLVLGEHPVVSGDEAVPVTRIVYGATIVRAGEQRELTRVRDGGDAYWDAQWKRTLVRR